MTTWRAFAVAALSIGFVAGARADGFVDEQTARAAGMGGAYVAQADDPTAIFFNPGALGLLKKKKGVVVNLATSEFRPFQYQGTAPGVGAGTTGNQASSRNTLPSGFVTMPLAAHLVFGIGAYNVFRTHSNWASPATFSGRFIATESTISAYDIAPTVGLQVTPSFGIGAGAIRRTSKVSVTRHLAANSAGVMQDIATETIDTDTKSSTGWSGGFLFRPSPKLSLGASYRSPMPMTYSGRGTPKQDLTGDAQFDALIAAS